MRIFVSSLMSEHYNGLRGAACSAIKTLGHEALQAEDLIASSMSAQVACLNEVRSADVMILILGEEYGSQQASGLSATHEEYCEARKASKPVLAFVEEGISPTTLQAHFIEEVQNWEQGLYTGYFRSASDLEKRVIRALHKHILDQATATVDEEELLERAMKVIPARPTRDTPLLFVAIVGGPSQWVIRPSELKSQELHKRLRSEALGDSDAVLDYSYGTDLSVQGNAIVLSQSSGGQVTLTERGDLLVVQPVMRRDPSRRSFPSIIVEDLINHIGRALQFGTRVLEQIDTSRRISHVAVVAAVLGASSWPWRTRQEHRQNANHARLSLENRDRIEGPSRFCGMGVAGVGWVHVMRSARVW